MISERVSPMLARWENSRTFDPAGRRHARDMRLLNLSGYKDAIDLDRLRHDPVMKVAVGRCPETGAPLASQSTISRLENAPSKTDAARL